MLPREERQVVIAHRRPMLLILALNALFPRLSERLTGAIGAQKVFRETTKHRGRLGGES